MFLTRAEEAARGVRERVREISEMVREISDAIKSLSELPPEERASAARILERLVAAEPEVKVVERPVPVERTVTVEKPVPVVPKGLEERVAATEYRLSRLEEALERLAEAQRDVAAAVKASLSSADEARRLREELEALRKELESVKKERELASSPVLVKSEMMREDGTVVREYDLHPALKALEKRTEFATDKLGPELIAELRATRQSIDSNLNRLMSLIESVFEPELRRRAPRIVEQIEERVRRFVGAMTEEERARELEEIDRQLSERLQGQGAQRAGQQAQGGGGQ